MTLIKQEDAIECVERGKDAWEVIDQISRLPSAEAEEIVRCKDCKYKRLYDEGETKYYFCALEDRPNRNWSVDDTDYCSWGDRREDGEA